MTAPAAIPRWTPDVEDVFVRGLGYIAFVRGRITASIEDGQPIVTDAGDYLHAAWVLLEGGHALHRLTDTRERQRLAKALMLEADTLLSDEAPEEQDDPAYYDGGE